MGAIPSPRDPRDIPAKAVQALGEYPSSYSNEFFKNTAQVEDQQMHGTCVGQAVSKGLEFYFPGKSLSGRFVYVMAKKLDNNPYEQGTYPRVGAKVAVDFGCATEEFVPDENHLPYSNYLSPTLDDATLANAAEQKVPGYTFINRESIDELCYYIYKNGFVTAAVQVGDWDKKTGMAKPGNRGWHQILVYGYQRIPGTKNAAWVEFVNSWGEQWGDRGRGRMLLDFDNEVDPNLGYSSLEVLDIITYTKVPKKVINEYKKKWPYKYFSPSEVQGLDEELVALLDKARGVAGVPFVITSGLRTKEQNRQAGGVPDSSHLTGKAVDLRATTGQERHAIIKGCLQAGFTRLGIYSTHIHVDIDTSKPQETIWRG